ncbi:hypothetical protein [Paraliomyxa miuraensis]|uniref:hypothetical protein n=1 Tax=Paraliomyxa miuraensis TaxID=376150 RepID=UPI002252762E|nr:hypothetical protein [Paraliomyxa miuraensis]MCX4245331.1 hypothetical protein [Paraliomyxa miuraensis]
MGTSHRAHLRLAYESLCHGDATTVLPHVDRALRRLATAHGHPEKVHLTLTALWLLVVQERMARVPAPSFEALLAAHPDLLDARALPLRYYHESTLADPLARRIFVLPDRGTAPRVTAASTPHAP